MSQDSTLYYIAAENLEGEDRSIFVCAHSPQHAYALMLNHWEETDDDMVYVLVYLIPTQRDIGAIGWEKVRVVGSVINGDFKKDEGEP